MPATRVAIIGAALDLGAGRRGVDMGPSAIRYAGLSERLERAGIEVEDRGNVQAALAETRETGTDNARFLDEILETCTRVAAEVEAARGDGLLPLVLGGDHSIAMGSLSGLAASGPGGVLWLDAHGDLNTPETTPSGNVHGMPLAAALGLCDGFSRDGLRLPAVDPQRVALVGVRSLDPGEQELVRELGVAVYTISDLDRRGMEPVIAEALERVAGRVVRPRLGRPGRRRSRGGARCRRPGARRPLVPRGASRAGARRGGRRARTLSTSSRSIRSTTTRTRRPGWPSSWRPARSA